MFEKEAEKYVMREDVITENDRVPFDNGYGFQTVSFEDEVKKGFQDGAEFGYNKANEWHYVKDGDLPKDDKQYLVLFFYNYRGKKEMSFGVRDNLHSDFEIHRCYTEQIIAWKEIVLPELKESK